MSLCDHFFILNLNHFKLSVSGIFSIESWHTNGSLKVKRSNNKTDLSVGFNRLLQFDLSQTQSVVLEFVLECVRAFPEYAK